MVGDGGTATCLTNTTMWRQSNLATGAFQSAYVKWGPPIPPHDLPQIPPYATRNCRTSELGAGGAVDPPQSPPTEMANASLGAPATSHDVDVLRKSPVIINEAFFARWDRTDCVTPGTMWFGVNRNQDGQYPFISQRWDEVMHLVSDWDPLSQRRRFLDGGSL